MHVTIHRRCNVACSRVAYGGDSLLQAVALPGLRMSVAYTG